MGQSFPVCQQGPPRSNWPGARWAGQVVGGQQVGGVVEWPSGRRVTCFRRLCEPFLVFSPGLEPKGGDWPHRRKISRKIFMIHGCRLWRDSSTFHLLRLLQVGRRAAPQAQTKKNATTAANKLTAPESTSLFTPTASQCRWCNYTLLSPPPPKIVNQTPHSELKRTFPPETFAGGKCAKIIERTAETGKVLFFLLTWAQLRPAVRRREGAPESACRLLLSGGRRGRHIWRLQR